MTKISYLHGIGSAEIIKRIDTENIDVTNLTEGELARYQNAEILFALADASADPYEKNALIADGNALLMGQGGSLEVQKFLVNANRNIAPGYQVPAVNGILSNAADKLKNALKNLVGNIIKKLLPAAGPVFLYLFLPASVGGRTGQKRAKIFSAFSALLKVTGISQSSAIAAIRKGIIKHFGKQPEVVLAEIAAKKINGIGVVPPQLIMTIVSIMLPIYKTIGKQVFNLLGNKGKLPDLSAGDMPDINELQSDLTPKGGTPNPNSGGGNPEPKSDNTALIIGAVLGGFLLLKK